MDVGPKVEDNIPEQVRAPRAVELAADDQAPVLEKVLETQVVGQAQLERFRAESEAMANRDDT
jgi:hypothetical protein